MRRAHRPVGAFFIGAAMLALSCCATGNATSNTPNQAGDLPLGATASGAAPVDKVTVAGDSISVGLGSQLRDAVDPSVTVRVIGEEGTGLARPDSFDWPDRLQALANEFPPDVLVFSVGSNDAQDLSDVDGDVVASFSDDAAWNIEYSQRLAESFDAFRDTGTTVLWVGHVTTEDETVGRTNRRVHRLATEVASTRDWVVVTDLAEFLDVGEEVAEGCLIADGLHLSTRCLTTAAELLASQPPIVP